MYSHFQLYASAEQVPDTNVGLQHPSLAQPGDSPKLSSLLWLILFCLNLSSEISVGN